VLRDPSPGSYPWMQQVYSVSMYILLMTYMYIPYGSVLFPRGWKAAWIILAGYAIMFPCYLPAGYMHVSDRYMI
jgi:hypothetical protein